MDILILDIGCTFSKALVYRADKIISRFVDRTPETAQCIIDTAISLVDAVLADGYEISAIIPMSFSESVITEDHDGDLTLFGVMKNVLPGVERPHYLKTGYPYHTFLSPAQQLEFNRSNKQTLRRALPVSTTIAVHLTNNELWKMWDHTHASNSGLYGNGKWLKEADKYEKWIYTKHTGSPFRSVVGSLKDTNIPVFLGGHDTLFAMYPKPYAYVSCGTYITASQPCEFMVEAREDWFKDVRWLQDVNGVYHRQLCMKSTDEIDHVQINRIRHFLSTDEIVVFGSYAEEMAGVLYDYAFQTKIVKDQQFIGAGRAVEEGLKQYSNMGTAAA